MNSTTVTLDYWRNFKPVVPDVINVAGNENTEIKISLKSLLLQGARDSAGESPTDGVLDKVDAQRGWRLTPMLLNQPELGRARLSDDKESLIYLPRAKFLGTECFNIRLTNGTQASDPIRVEVEVKPYYRMWFDIYRVSESRFVFKERHEWPPEVEKPYLYAVFWWWTRPVAEWNEKRQAFEIFTRRSLVLATEVSGIYGSFWPRIRLQPRFDHNFTTDEGLRGFDGTSERVYQPTGTRGVVQMEGRVYNKVGHALAAERPYAYVDTENWEPLLVETQPEWWNSGNILPISAEK